MVVAEADSMVAAAVTAAADTGNSSVADQNPD
jgi:hypothetical protein